MSTEIEKLPTFTRTKLGPGHYAVNPLVGDPVSIQIIKRFGVRPGRSGPATRGWAVVIVGKEVDRKPTLREAEEYVEQWIEARGKGVRDRIAAPGPLAPYVDAVERAVEDLRKQAATAPPTAEPITVAEFEARIADHPLDNLHDLDRTLMSRIVKRARYDALREVIRTIDDFYDGAAENHVEMAHQDDHDSCLQFEADDMRRIVNDTANALGVPTPWRSEAGA